MYNVKAVKTFHGHDGYGWEANLYKGGKKVATVVEDGWGGNLKFYFEGETKEQRVTQDEIDLNDFCKTLPQWKSEYDNTMHDTNREIFVDGLVTDKLYEKDVKKLLKKFAIFDNGQIFTYGCSPDHPSVRPQIKKKHPNAVVLNDVPLEDAIRFYKSAA
jgi:hypothetical protein